MAEIHELLASEERKSYGAVFVLAVALLLACTLWAIWQDAFSRHQWKQYKYEFYKQALSRYERMLADARGRLAEDPKYVRLTKELAERRRALAGGSTARQLAVLRRQLSEAKVREEEADLELRIAKGELEEAWYWYNKAVDEGRDPAAARARVERLEAVVRERQAALDAARAATAEIQGQIDAILGRVEEIERALRPYYAEIDRLKAKLDAVSWSLLGRRIVRVPMLEQTVLRAFERNNFDEWVDRVDRCVNCHAAIDKEGFEDLPNPLKTHPDREYYLGNHDPRRFGCTPCHGGQGASINSVEQAHGLVEFWEDPLLDVRDKVQARCLKCHGSVLGLRGAEVAARGERLFRELGCHGCHLLEGFENLPKVGPSLERIAAKVSPEWLVEWIQDPTAFRPRTRMPSFFLSREEAIAIAAYLLDASAEASRTWLAQEQPVALAPGGRQALAEQGRRLIDSIGCRGCHGIAPGEGASQVAEGIDTAPNLSRIGEKTSDEWMARWLADPRGFSSVARMPRLRLSAEEIRAIVAALAAMRQRPPLAPDASLRAELADPKTIARGKQLVRRLGCFGCHRIRGMENESRVSVELTAFGSKSVDELFFGHRTDLPRTWDAWTANKVRTPRTYATERIPQAMPQFGLTAADARAITVFLASKTRRTIASAYLPERTRRAAQLERGRMLVDRYNCHGCHEFDGQQAAIARWYADRPENAPPLLVGEGSKLQPEWFFDFLMNPVKLRPWLKVRMPSFDLAPGEATAIVDFFAALEGREARPVVLATRPGSRPSHRWLPSEVPDCYACHPARGQPGGRTISTVELSEDQIASWVEENLGIPVRPATAAESRGAAGGG
ncbi:MAG: hypothetical protein D6815_10825 [Candidatus Dadabacteria bacterium]|nr:MAG: hypothetical protein D6815_10825 [Candidatus Dadabacteria bacterium]